MEEEKEDLKAQEINEIMMEFPKQNKDGLLINDPHFINHIKVF